MLGGCFVFVSISLDKINLIYVGYGSYIVEGNMFMEKMEFYLVILLNGKFMKWEYEIEGE